MVRAVPREEEFEFDDVEIYNELLHMFMLASLRPPRAELSFSETIKLLYILEDEVISGISRV